MASTTRIARTGAAALAAVAVIGACANSATKEAAPSASSPAQTSAPALAAHNKADTMFAHMMVPHHEQAVEMSDIILGKQGIDPRVVDLARQIKAAQGPEIEQMEGWLKQWGVSGKPGMGDMPGMEHGGMMGPGAGTGTTSTTTDPSTTMPMPSGSMMPGMGDMGDMGDMGGMDGMAGMEGMMSAADMDALKAAQGVEADRLFLTQMIRHHQGAIAMAQNEISNGEFPEAVALAKSIAESQQKEIDTMNQILSSL